jgi:pyruvate dehydrogenase E2 component (dihydrolipoamide acetyltransferase)
MIKEIKLPEIADNIDSAIVLTIMVSEGDQIEKDQDILEMESDKATFEMPSNFAGKVKEIKVKEGDEVKIGQVVMTVETDEEGEEEKKEEKGKGAEEKEKEEKEEGEDEKGEKDKEEKDEKDEKDEKEEEDDEKKEKEAKIEEEEEKAEDEEEEEEDKEGGGKEEKKKEAEEKTEVGEKPEIAAAPSIRRLARELGVDIQKVEGTGPYDRITSDDVKAYAKSIVQQSGDEAAAVSEDYELPDQSKFGPVERKPMESIRQRIAKNMTASWQTIPHVFHFDKADVTELEAFRKKYEKEAEKQGVKLTVTAILLKILAKALEIFPRFNASLDMKNGEIVYKKYYHIGVAVDTNRGLLVPVIRDVDKKSILTLSKELGEMAEKARNKKIKPEELQGGNMALSNLGGIGGTNFTPIVYRPNVAILGVSRTATEAVYFDGEFKSRMILPLSLSYDHRLIDGAEAARFMRWLCEALENPLLTMFKGDA